MNEEAVVLKISPYEILAIGDPNNKTKEIDEILEKIKLNSPNFGKDSRTEKRKFKTENGYSVRALLYDFGSGHYLALCYLVRHNKGELGKRIKKSTGEGEKREISEDLWQPLETVAREIESSNTGDTISYSINE